MADVVRARRRRATDAEAPAAEALDPSARAAILDQPARVLDDPMLMAALLKAVDGEARRCVDLRGVAMARLERRLAQLREAHRDVVDAAWENLTGMDQVHGVALALLDAEDLSTLLTVLTERTRELLEIDGVGLALTAAPALRSRPELAARPPGLWISLSSDVLGARAWPQAAQAGGARVGEGALARLGGAGAVDADLFGPEARRFGSEALVALDLGPKLGPALLGFAAAAPDRFHIGQSPDLMLFLGAVVERMLRRRLA